jgi:hypothetical protein
VSDEIVISDERIEYRTYRTPSGWGLVRFCSWMGRRQRFTTVQSRRYFPDRERADAALERELERERTSGREKGFNVKVSVIHDTI